MNAIRMNGNQWYYGYTREEVIARIGQYSAYKLDGVRYVWDYSAKVYVRR